MHRISPNNPVRRRLFEEELTDEARIDNFANVLQETAARERIEKMRKWNFDFANEVPLEGDYEWVKVEDENDWIGVKSDAKPECNDVENAKENDTFLPMKAENEVTPKGNKDGDSAPLIRKRRKDDVTNTGNDKGVRRRISFD